MAGNETLALHVLCFFEIAVLRRVEPGRYAIFGEVPAFYTALFPSGADGAPCTTPWEDSPMLDFFLTDAERFFESGADGSVKSGVWEEDGRTEPGTALQAAATTLNGVQVLILHLQRDQYVKHCDILRKAREHLLEKRDLAHDVALFKEKSRMDGLTAVFNKTTFMEILQDEIRRSQLLNYSLFLLLLDIDDFKKVNDTYGHPVGDAVLQATGACLKKTLRRGDIVARYGGEEFVVLMSGRSPTRARNLAEKIRNHIADMHMPKLPRITVSIGCTAYLAEESAAQLFERADNALYDAKRAGKNVVRVR